MRRLHRRLLGPTPLLAAAALAACGGGHHLDEYPFPGRTLAAVYYAPPAPDLLTGGYDGDSRNPVQVAIEAGSRVAKELEGRRAQARLDSAAARVDPGPRMTERTLERVSRYLGTRPVDDRTGADYLLEVDILSYGIDARGDYANLFVNAEVVLLDGATGREIWDTDVRAWDRITPDVSDGVPLPADIATAGVLRSLDVADFERLLVRLADYTGDVVARELRQALRDARDD